MSEIDFAAILCSRLCHDLVSPVGAISNGIEVLTEENEQEIKDQVMALLEDSARRTSDRLQFFRLAFGAAGGFNAVLDLREAHRALGAFFGGDKVKLDWQPDPRALPKSQVKLLLNLALLAGEGLIRGGTLAISIDESESGTTIRISAFGERFIFSDLLYKALANEMTEEELEPRTAPAYLAGRLVDDLRAKLDVITPEEPGIQFVVDVPEHG